MIEPTVGRMVWYRPLGSSDSTSHAAIITHIHSNNCVNLAVFDSNGYSYSRTSVILAQGEGEQGGPYAEWMPYQKGQAAKTEELEKKIADTAV